MTIFQIIQKPQLRGAEVFATQLATHLSRNGHKVYLIALYPGDSKLDFSGEVIKLNRPVKHRWFDRKGWKQLDRLIKTHQPDIIQCNAGDTLKFAVLSKMFFRWKQPVVARNASMVSLYIKSPLVKVLNGLLYRKANHIISVSHSTRDDLVKLFPFAHRKCSVIPVGTEPVVVRPVTWQGGDSAQKHIVHVGGFTFEKNHEGLLRIFKQLTDKRAEEIHLHLLGEGILQTAVHEMAVSLGLNGKITFYGWVSNPADYIAKADILVLPSIIEGLPGVLLEGMYCKTPVVAYDVGGVAEIVNHQTGYLVPKNDEPAFVHAVEKVLFESGAEKVQQAYELVTAFYNNERIAERFAETYENIIKK